MKIIHIIIFILCAFNTAILIVFFDFFAKVSQCTEPIDVCLNIKNISATASNVFPHLNTLPNTISTFKKDLSDYDSNMKTFETDMRSEIKTINTKIDDLQNTLNKILSYVKIT